MGAQRQSEDERDDEPLEFIHEISQPNPANHFQAITEMIAKISAYSQASFLLLRLISGRAQ